jgi:hypothetical protein
LLLGLWIGLFLGSFGGCAAGSFGGSAAGSVVSVAGVFAGVGAFVGGVHWQRYTKGACGCLRVLAGACGCLRVLAGIYAVIYSIFFSGFCGLKNVGGDGRVLVEKYFVLKNSFW